MNVYDFDGTIYQGDSSVDFANHCILHNKKCLMAVPEIFKGTASYLFKKISTKNYKEIFFSFLKRITPEELEVLVEGFWEEHSQKIVGWYQHKQDDVIISASPEFLLEPIKKELGISSVLATRMDRSTGIIQGENCKGEEKVKRFKEAFGESIIDEFYSDSLSDSPLAKQAKKAYYVKNEKIEDWPKEGAYKGNAVNDNIANYKGIIAYGFFGVLTTLINMATYYGCYNMMGIANIPSTIIAWILAVIFAFITNKIWVFDSKSFDVKILIYEISTFFAARLLTGILDVGIMWLAVDILSWKSTVWKLISNGIVIVLNYIASKQLIFKRK